MHDILFLIIHYFADAALDTDDGFLPHRIGDVSVDVPRGFRGFVPNHRRQCLGVHIVSRCQVVNVYDES